METEENSNNNDSSNNNNNIFNTHTFVVTLNH